MIYRGHIDDIGKTSNRADSPRSGPLHVTMLVVDANEVQGLTHKDESKRSPVLHTAIHNLLEGLQVREDVKVTVLYARQRINPGEDRVEGAIHYCPVSYRPVPFLGMGGPLLGRAIALLRKLRQLKPDVVHAQGTERESGLVAACSTFPSVLTLHGNLTEIAKTVRAKPFSYFWLAAKLELWSLPRVSVIHCISTHTQQSVRSSAKNTWIIPNAVANGYFDVINRHPKHPSIVCIAGIAEWKNQLILVEASDRLHDEFPGTQVDFFGACDPESPYGKAFIEALKSRPWCHFHGQASKEKLMKALETASCSVLPSLMENCPLSILESMAAGVAVIGSNVGGIPDLIEHGRTGKLFDPLDSTKLGEILVELHENRPESNKIAQNGRSAAEQRFTINAVTEEHLRMYRNLALAACSHE